MNAPRWLGPVGAALGLALVVALVPPPAEANHLPSECWEGGFHRDDPECAFGPCVHHPPEAPADASCHPSCEGLRERVALLEQDLRNLDERLAAAPGEKRLHPVDHPQQQRRQGKGEACMDSFSATFYPASTSRWFSQDAPAAFHRVWLRRSR